MREGKRRAAGEQKDVLAEKDDVIETPARGLQQYGDDALPEGPISGGGGGTAERAAKITRGQIEAEEQRERR